MLNTIAVKKNPFLDFALNTPGTSTNLRGMFKNKGNFSNFAGYEY